MTIDEALAQCSNPIILSGRHPGHVHLTHGELWAIKDAGARLAEEVRRLRVDSEAATMYQQQLNECAADLAAARAVLDGAASERAVEDIGYGVVALIVDRAAWEAWVARGRGGASQEGAVDDVRQPAALAGTTRHTPIKTPKKGKA